MTKLSIYLFPKLTNTFHCFQQPLQQGCLSVIAAPYRAHTSLPWPAIKAAFLWGPVVLILALQSASTSSRAKPTIFAKRTNTAICPRTAIINYIGIQPPTPGPLFMLQSGKPLSRAYLVHHLKQGLHAVELPEAKFNGHSFRISAVLMQCSAAPGA